MLNTITRMYNLCILYLSLALMTFANPLTFAQENAKPIQVACTTPDLGSLTREVGGDEVSVTVFAKGLEDAHFVEAKPSFIKVLSRVDLYIQTGMELEIGWAPPLLQNARNGRILPNGAGYLDASAAISPLEIPSGPIDRSMGDIHPLGNPHYLLDPLNGLKVAQLIRDKLIQLRPDKRKYFEDRYAAFKQKLDAALVGETLARRYDTEKLALLFEHGKLESFLKEEGEEALLNGWLGLMLSHFGTKAVSDHNMWPYFARRFGIKVLGFMEPKPGISPTTKHLGELVKIMQAEGVKMILAAPYYDPRHASFLSEKTGARVINMAHQVGAREGTEDYFEMIDYNIRQIVVALGGGV